MIKVEYSSCHRNSSPRCIERHDKVKELQSLIHSNNGYTGDTIFNALLTNGPYSIVSRYSIQLISMFISIFLCVICAVPIASLLPSQLSLHKSPYVARTRVSSSDNNNSVFSYPPTHPRSPEEDEFYSMYCQLTSSTANPHCPLLLPAHLLSSMEGSLPELRT